MTREEEFTHFIGKLIFAPEHCGWSALPPEYQECFCAFAAQAGVETLFLLTIGEELPKKFMDAFSEVYHREAMTRLIEKAQLKTLYRQLDERRIPHIALKGADLAFRLYPDPALRPHDDWDILFHKDDCPAVIQLLASQGWQSYSGHSLDNLEIQNHHYERLHNDKSSIEIHWTLPNFGSASNEEIWQETIADNHGNRHLTPEMTLLLLCAHASQDCFCHVSKWRLLLDAGYILRHDTVDWQKLRRLSDKWGIIQPALLLSLWKEFFPEGMIPLDDINTPQQQALKELFQMREKFNQADNRDKWLVVGQRRFWPWLKQELSFYCHPALIRRKYHLQRHQLFRLALCAMVDFARKTWYFCSRCRSRKCRDIQHYYETLDRVKKSIDSDRR